MWGYFYSRQQGWVNADVHLRRMKVYCSPSTYIPQKYIQLIREKTGKEIIQLQLPFVELNRLAKTFPNWYWYEQNLDIGCYTQL